ncbi:MAG: hypothetical protein K6E50_05915 [Lachnospiraceae bacterium]|nr:hypothetical protein [Lachnospiraceae bacterium]
MSEENVKKVKKEKPVRKKARGEANTERQKAIRDFLKSLIFPLCFLAVIGIAVFAIINLVNPEVEKNPVVPYGYDGEVEPVVLENDQLIFSMDPTTTLFTVTKKSTGKVWSSYIEEAESDSKALSEEKGRMQSNLLLTYSIKSGLETIYDTKRFSVDNSIYEISKDGDTLKVKYTLGKVSREYIMPTVIRVAELDAYRDKMEKSDSSMVKDMYKKYDIKKLKKGDNKEELLEKYPVLATDPIYVLKADAREDRKNRIEKALEGAGYTYDQYLADKELDQSESEEDNQLFNVEMDFRLDGDDMIVEVPLDSLEYNADAPITLLSPLPYFGAGSKDQEGFMLVPEGGGGIIEYNNGKIAQNSYYANMYGWDMCLRRRYVIHNTRAYFNAYGQSTEDGSFLCIMEDGSSYASVKASVSGKVNDYNFVYADYQIIPKEQFEISDMSSSAVYSFLPSLPEGEKLVQRYRFIDSSDYVDMAYAYRDYLETTYGEYMSLNSDEKAPVSVEILGAVDKVQQILGVPVSLPLKLTTYKEAGEMIEDMQGSDIGKISVKYTGWCNGGVNQKILTSVNTIPALGSKKDLSDLGTSASGLGVDLYLDGITQYEHRSNLFNGFISYRDAARQLTKERAELFNYSHVTYAAREGFKSYYLLHTSLAMTMADNLVAAAKTYGTGVSFQDIGMDLSSDFYRKETHSREDTKAKNKELLKSLDDKKIMINMGNDYAVPYVDMVTNMDLKGSEYTIIDENVPFYQIAIHGYIDYTGDPINISGDDQEELLRCVEYGAGLNFTLMKESSFALQKTLYTEYYGCEYAAWRDRMFEMCKRYNRELGHCFKQEMKDHEILSPYVRATTYADGTKVYVNYSFSEDYVAEDGTKVPARDYTVVR